MAALSVIAGACRSSASSAPLTQRVLRVPIDRRQLMVSGALLGMVLEHQYFSFACRCACASAINVQIIIIFFYTIFFSSFDNSIILFGSDVHTSYCPDVNLINQDRGTGLLTFTISHRQFYKRFFILAVFFEAIPLNGVSLYIKWQH